MTLKLKAVEYAEKTSKEAAARIFTVDTKRIREWCSQKEQLVSMTKSRGRSESIYMELDERRLMWKWKKSYSAGL